MVIGLSALFLLAFLGRNVLVRRTIARPIVGAGVRGGLPKISQPRVGGTRRGKDRRMGR
jgi:hypothetical protein